MVPERKKTGSSSMNVFNLERIFLRFDAVKTHNSQFDLIEISHSRCTRKIVSQYYATKNVIPESRQLKTLSYF